MKVTSDQFKSILLTLTVALFITSGSGATAQAQESRCENVFASSLTQNAQVRELTRLRNNGQSTWLRYDRWLRSDLKGRVSPLLAHHMDADTIGRVHSEFARVFPGYHNYFQVAKQRSVSLQQYMQLRQQARTQILRILRNANSSDLERFAALEINRIMSLIHAKVEFPPVPQEQEKEQEEKKQQQDQKKQEKKEEDDSEEDQPPQWQDMPDSYQPKNKDISNPDGKSKKQYDMLKTTVAVPKKLLRAKVYDVISREGQWSAAPLTRPQTPMTTQTPQVIGLSRLLVAGAQRIDLPLQYGAAPVLGEHKGFSVLEVAPQEYEVRITDSSLKEVDVPLIESPDLSFQNGATTAFFTTQSGIARNLWPQELLEYLNGLKAKNLPPLQTAAELEKYLSREGGYLYFSKGDRIDEAELERLKAQLDDLLMKYPLPVALAHLKSFNCDGAATLTTVLLRDFFGIPTRPVGGRTISGSKLINGQRHYVSQSSSPLHAWVDVWDANQWHPFDMTPELNNPDMGEGKPSDLEQDSEQERSQDQRQNHQQQGQGQKQNSQPSKEQKDKGKDQQEDEGQTPSERELNDKLKLRTKGVRNNSSHKDPKSPEDALYHAVAQHLNEKLIMDADRKGIVDLVATWFEKLNEFARARVPLSAAYEKTKRLYYDQLSNLAKAPFSGVLTDIQRKLLNGDMTTAYSNLMSLRRTTESLREHRELSDSETQFISEIDDVIARMKRHNHKDAEAYDLAKRILQGMPGKISREWLQRKYGPRLLSLGDPALTAFAQDILSGRLDPLLLASTLKDYANLVLNSEKIPNYRNEKTSQRAPVQMRTNDLIIARSPLEIQRMLLNPTPGEPLFAPLIEGRQFAVGQREVRRVPDPKAPIERKTSVVYYDVSESMEGTKAQTQDALLLAFVDIALSEVDPFGRPTHDVILVPFNDDLGQAIHISSKEEALQFISNRIAFQTKARDGTNIEKALLHFYDTVASAHHSSLQERDLSRVLKRANLILFSDGGSNVDQQKINEARKQVPSSVNVYMNFVAIGETNETLQQLADSSAAQSKKSLYRDLTWNAINQALANARPEVDPEAFASQDRVPAELLNLFSKILGRPPLFQASHDDPTELLRLADQIDFKESASVNMRNPELAIGIRTMAVELSKFDLPKSVKIEFMTRLLGSYARMSGRALNSLTLTERDSLRILTEWALK